MIRNHRFHSAWWGEPAGVIDDVAFLALPAAERARMLREFAWVELRAPLAEADPHALLKSGFAQVDTQIPFRIGIAKVTPTPSLDGIEVERASELPFTIGAGELAPFTHERFRHLPGVTPEKLDDRFVRWANLLIAQAPEWCLRITSGGATQGWFLSAGSSRGLGLELAMLHRDATIAGPHLYRKALVTYAALGARVGSARFSVENTAVLNVYASLGAQFLPPTGVWLWTRPAT